MFLGCHFEELLGVCVWKNFNDLATRVIEEEEEVLLQKKLKTENFMT